MLQARRIAHKNSLSIRVCSQPKLVIDTLRHASLGYGKSKQFDRFAQDFGNFYSPKSGPDSRVETQVQA